MHSIASLITFLPHHVYVQEQTKVLVYQKDFPV
jgi:hypothetical protein